MAFNLRNRNFLKLLDFTPKEIHFLLDLSAELKRAKYAGTEQKTLQGKNIALIFEKSSTVLAVPLKWRRLIKVHKSLTSALLARKLAIKSR